LAKEKLFYLQNRGKHCKRVIIGESKEMIWTENQQREWREATM
jgi:hypothetical protein